MSGIRKLMVEASKMYYKYRAKCSHKKIHIQRRQYQKYFKQKPGGGHCTVHRRSFGAENVLYQGGYIDDESLQRLIEKDAVRDLRAHFINEHGEICDKELDGRTISIDLKYFANIKSKVCVATGPEGQSASRRAEEEVCRCAYNRRSGDAERAQINLRIGFFGGTK